MVSAKRINLKLDLGLHFLYSERKSFRVWHLLISQWINRRSRGNQLIHRRLYKTKSIGSRSDPECQACVQSMAAIVADSYGG